MEPNVLELGNRFNTLEKRDDLITLGSIFLLVTSQRKSKSNLEIRKLWLWLHLPVLFVDLKASISVTRSIPINQSIKLLFSRLQIVVLPWELAMPYTKDSVLCAALDGGFNPQNRTQTSFLVWNPWLAELSVNDWYFLPYLLNDAN